MKLIAGDFAGLFLFTHPVTQGNAGKKERNIVLF
jgi:hypothetical protein